jgi:polar amino acid transport system permease protein
MLETFNIRVILEYLPLYLQGLKGTAWLSLSSLIGALLFGIFACVMRLLRLPVFTFLSTAYIEAVRSTPLLAQLYFLYYGLPSLGVRLTEIQTGVIALSLNSGAYMAEILRAGVIAIPKGHVEAGISTGLNFMQRLRYIILPQAIGVSIPPLLGQMIVLVKDSSLLSLISILELTRAGQLLASDRIMPAEGFFTTALFYLALYFILKSFTNWWQKKLINKRR